MPETRNLCAQIPIDLHQRICEAREQSGQTTSQYITNLLLEYYEMKEEKEGKKIMANNTRTMAFQIPENLFLRIKAHLDRETTRTGKKLTQREFVLGLVEAALDEAERQAGTDSPESQEQLQEETGVSPSETREDDSKNSDLPSDAPTDGILADDVPSSGVSEGEESSHDGDIDREGDVGVGETPTVSSEGESGEADGGDD